MENRYNKSYEYDGIVFYLSDYTPDIEECKILILKMLEQCVRDYCNFFTSEKESDQQIWQEARALLFDNGYRVLWGDMDIEVAQLLDIVDIDLEWFREEVLKKFKAFRQGLK